MYSRSGYASACDKRKARLTIITTVFLGVSIVVLTVLLAVAGLVLAQRLVPLSLRQSHNTAIGIIYGALYVMFGMMVGFSAYLVLNKYTVSQNNTANEASSVVEIHRLAEQFPEPLGGQIQDLATSYTQAVVDEEWPLMSDGQTSSRAEALVDELARSIQSFEPNTSAEQALFSQALERVHELYQDRAVRTLDVREGLPPILWVVLVALGIAIVLFTYFLGMENAYLHTLAVAALTAGIAFVILTMATLDNPFGGDLRVGPDAFESALATIEGTSE